MPARPQNLWAWRLGLPVGTGASGKTHPAVSIARACIRAGRRGRFFNVVDLVSRLGAKAGAERQGRTADLISCPDFRTLDELGYLPFAQTGGQLLFRLISKLYERKSIIVTSTSRTRSCSEVVLERPAPTGHSGTPVPMRP